jgi:hypothetical protein
MSVNSLLNPAAGNEASLSDMSPGHSIIQTPRDGKATRSGAIVPRPPNAFFCFRSHLVQERREAVALGSSDKFGAIDSQTSLSRTAAILWSSMGVAAREPFFHMAAKKKREHSLAHPSYKYTPRKRMRRNFKAIATRVEADAQYPAFSDPSSVVPLRSHSLGHGPGCLQEPDTTSPQLPGSYAVGVLDFSRISTNSSEDGANQCPPPGCDAADATTAGVPNSVLDLLHPAPWSGLSDQSVVAAVEDDRSKIVYQSSSAGAVLDDLWLGSTTAFMDWMTGQVRSPINYDHDPFDLSYWSGV